MTWRYPWIVYRQILLLLLLPLHVFTTIPSAWCPQNVLVCNFTLVVDYRLTMTWGRQLVKATDGLLFSLNATNYTQEEALPVDDVVTADGYFEPRLVMTYNGTIPGPALHVTEGQTVRLTIINRMMHESTTVHFHGIFQRGSPYSDGVPFVSQCPILPGQTFVYTFRADPQGTFFYHSHSGPQMTNGLYGPFIVHPNPLLSKNCNCEQNESQIQVPIEDERILVFQDWNHDWDSNMLTMKMRYGLYSKGKAIPRTETLAGIYYSSFHFQSGIINGRGRFYDENGQHNEAPLSNITVDPGKLIRLRVINSGDIHPFRVSIDDHSLLVVTSDGQAIKPVAVESVIINPGERFDIIIQTNQSVGNYWIRGHTMQIGYNNTAEAILHYVGAPLHDEPTSKKRTCTEVNPCIVLNCPFQFYPKDSYTKCYNFDKIQSLQYQNLQTPQDTVTEYFLNFAFPGVTETPGSVNGRSHTDFTVDALGQPHQITQTCSRDDCGDDKVCHCPYVLSYNHNDLVQLVLLNMGQGKGWDHPVHLHGHSFQVVKIGFPMYNETTGAFIKENEDIDCNHLFCNKATWANSSWSHGNVPDVELDHPPLKDDIIVPSGGYVVIRYRADNPGLWIIHCHLLLHTTDGMMAMLNESFPLWPKPPPDFPTCHDFYDVTRPYRDLQERGPR